MVIYCEKVEKYFCQPTKNTCMEFIPTKKPISQSPDGDKQFDKDFRPKGAVAFFILLVILGMIIWYGIYFLMLERM
jgi:hypothetical protein